MSDLNLLDPQKNIILKNAHQNNLKNIDVAIPHNKFIVITGVSGSGKSSLAFETLYEEGRRRYVESLSSYVRQFLGKIKKPKVDFIKGLPPAIAIEQRRSTSNSRSTVGTVTEIYHYLKLLYARAGTTFSPVSGKEVKRDTIDDIVAYFDTLSDKDQVKVMTELITENGRGWNEELTILVQKGFTRIVLDNKIEKVEDLLDQFDGTKNEEIIRKRLTKSAYLLVDRIIINKNDPDQRGRIADSVQTAFFEGKGRCIIEINEKDSKLFSNEFEIDGIKFEEPTPDLFSFNSPYGACPECGGFGEHLGIDENKVIPNKQLSVYDGAVICWEGEKMSKWKTAFIHDVAKYNFPIFTPYNELSDEHKDLLWEGGKGVEGIDDFFHYLESNTYKVHYRIFLSRFKGRTNCKRCKGSRLRKEANFVKIGGKSIGQLVLMPISDLYEFFQEYSSNNPDNKIAQRLLEELNKRLKMMVDVGLGYLSMNRTSRSLSGGELQRIQLIYSIGSNLTGSLYILDEPSIGLHSKDTEQLIGILKNLKKLGNTVVVVEHDEDIIKAADEIIDLGPFAGSNGGHLVFQGNYQKLRGSNQSLTAQYLNEDLKIPVPEKRRETKGFVEIIGAHKYNLKNIDVKIPLDSMTVVTGVSGSGKTTLVKEVIYESFKNISSDSKPDPYNCQDIKGDFDAISHIEFVSQDSIDRSKRSNPVTYLKVFDHIRELLSSQQASKIRGYTPAYFSFNVEGGRCEECKGEGKITVEMQFVADMHLLCEECKGKRYKSDILEITYKDKNIDDILNMTIADAMDFFQEQKSIVTGLYPLMQVGLDYLQLGQPTSTLSGGEAQRLKLASFLAKGNKNKENILFIFDEPTTGLHFHDINKLLDSFNALIEIGHTLIVIEHNLEVIKCADYLIDLGPEGGELGGHLVYQGTPEGILKIENSHTARFLKEKIKLN